MWGTFVLSPCNISGNAKFGIMSSYWQYIIYFCDYICQVNQNTAAGASKINGFQQAHFNNFNELPAVPARVASTRRPVSQNVPQDDIFEANKV